MAEAEPWHIAVLLGLVTTVASVAGGAVGYWVGVRFSPWVHRKFSGPRLEKAEAWYERYGEWIVVLAAFTPLPFKVFTVTSGLLGLRFWPFLAAAFIGRALRFVPEAVLASLYGEAVIAWLDRGGLIVLVVSLVVLAVLYYTHRGARKRRRARERIEP